MLFSSASHKANIHFKLQRHASKMNGMTMVNTFIHYPSLSCARVIHIPSAFHLYVIVGFSAQRGVMHSRVYSEP